jgi:hypothetical protein
MTDYSIKITKADNGFICEWQEDDIKHEQVFEEKDSEDDDLNCVNDMLWFVKEHFGVFWSKHNKKNLKICVWDMSKDKEVEEE